MLLCPARSDLTSVPVEHDAGLEGLADLVVEPRTAVRRRDLRRWLVLLLGHQRFS